MTFCAACQRARQHLIELIRTPWERLLIRYEFMIVFASFSRNMHFYSAMDRGQIKTMYSQIVSFSPARMLVADALISSYNKRHREGENVPRDPLCLAKSSSPLPPSPPLVPCELSDVVTLALGNGVPKRFINECISGLAWKGYDEMVLSTLASAEVVRCGAHKYLTLIRSSVRNVSSLHTILALAIVGWQFHLSDYSERCTCGVWTQALELISCFVLNTETSLSVQEETRVSAYIRTLMDITEDPVSHQCYEAPTLPAPDYQYAFRDLLVCGLEELEKQFTSK